jgi:hypothetical protein
VWQFGRKRKWWELNDKLKHLADSPITEKEMTQLKCAEGKEKRRKRERNMYQFPSQAAQVRMNAMRNNILEELLKHMSVIRNDTENPTLKLHFL